MARSLLRIGDGVVLGFTASGDALSIYLDPRAVNMACSLEYNLACRRDYRVTSGLTR